MLYDGFQRVKVGLGEDPHSILNLTNPVIMILSFIGGNERKICIVCDERKWKLPKILLQ